MAGRAHEAVNDDSPRRCTCHHRDYVEPENGFNICYNAVDKRGRRSSIVEIDEVPQPPVPYNFGVVGVVSSLPVTILTATKEDADRRLSDSSGVNARLRMRSVPGCDVVLASHVQVDLFQLANSTLRAFFPTILSPLN